MPTEKILFVSATEYAIEHFAAPYIQALSDSGTEVHVVTGGEIGDYNAPDGVSTVSIALSRKPDPLNDTRELFRLIRRMRRERYTSVYSISPKGGLIGQLAAWASRVPHRTHFFTGQVWKTKTGPERLGLKLLDRLIGRTTSQGYVDSQSQVDFLVDEGVLPPAKADVLGSGSVSGIATEQFQFSQENRSKIRERHGLTDDDVVIFFLGRISKVKGVAELVEAFARVNQTDSRIKLLIVGPDDGDLQRVQSLIAGLGLSSVVKSEWESTPRPAIHYSAADVLCVPSHMEGFGNVVLEAACAGVPTIGSDIYGLRDAIVDGETGLLFPEGDLDALAEAILTLGTDNGRRFDMGRAAQQRVENEFSQQRLVEAFLEAHRTATA